MTLEETIAALLDAKLAPLVDANRRLTATVNELRKSLPAQLVTVAEAAEALRVTERTIHRWIQDGSIPVRRIGRSIRIDLAAVQRGPTSADLRAVEADYRSQYK